MPAVGDDGVGDGGKNINSEEQGELNDKLVLLVILLVIFHVGAFVSFTSFLVLIYAIPYLSHGVYILAADNLNSVFTDILGIKIMEKQWK